ncbi:MAG: transglutaminase N-terminal domain-containing protein [Oscillatoria sp. PMC 1051.18]|nr:transglutaminase N-terminal domain-containing protein [Oscillatoria sp. PMC 1051.18]
MRYKISHQTSYQYNQLVLLKPHVLRLRPRCDVGQKLHDFSLKIEPKTIRISEITDLDGNSNVKDWSSTTNTARSQNKLCNFRFQTTDKHR